MSQHRSPEDLRREIERTRQELGETVEALSHKADVKTQARLKKEEVKDQVTHTVSDNQVPVAALAGGIALLLILLRIIRRR